MTEATTRSYIPAFGIHLLLPLYDPFARLLGADRARVDLVEDATLRPGMRILDVGCGTGTLLEHVATRYPGVEVVGLDPDPKGLARARRKLHRAGVREPRLDQGFSDVLPYPDQHFDRVFSSFMLHHLDLPVKRATLAEVYRVLKPGGALHLVDGGGPDGHHHHNPLARLVHGSSRLRDQLGDAVLDLLREAGFTYATTTRHRSAWGGVAMAWYRAPRPG